MSAMIVVDETGQGITPAPATVEAAPGTRCDADGVAEAAVVILLASGGMLAMCSHHARQHGFLPAFTS